VTHPNAHHRFHVELERREVAVILGALRRFTRPDEATDFSDEFKVTAANLDDYLRTETGVDE
jgi:hypothetical protein